MSNIGKAILITTDHRIELLDIEFNYDDLAAVIGADFTEIVRTKFLNSFFGSDNVIMLVDEIGAIIDRPVNKIASMFYPGIFEGHPIFGDVLITGYDIFAGDLVSLDNAADCFGLLLDCFHLVDCLEVEGDDYE